MIHPSIHLYIDIIRVLEKEKDSFQDATFFKPFAMNKILLLLFFLHNNNANRGLRFECLAVASLAHNNEQFDSLLKTIETRQEPGWKKKKKKARRLCGSRPQLSPASLAVGPSPSSSSSSSSTADNDRSADCAASSS